MKVYEIHTKSENGDAIVAFFPVWTKHGLLISPEVRDGDGRIHFVDCEGRVSGFRYTEQDKERVTLSVYREMYELSDTEAINNAVQKIIDYINSMYQCKSPASAGLLSF